MFHVYQFVVGCPREDYTHWDLNRDHLVTTIAEDDEKKDTHTHN